MFGGRNELTKLATVDYSVRWQHAYLLTRFSTCRPLMLNHDVGSVPVKLLFGSRRALSVYRELIASGKVPEMLLPAPNKVTKVWVPYSAQLVQPDQGSKA